MTSKTVKGAFSEGEWKALQWAVSDVLEVAGSAEHGLLAGHKSSRAMGKYARSVADETTSRLLRALLGDINFLERDPHLEGGRDRELYLTSLAERVRHAMELVTRSAPEDVDAYRDLLLGMARAGAQAAKGVNPEEQELLDRLAEAVR